MTRKKKIQHTQPSTYTQILLETPFRYHGALYFVTSETPSSLDDGLTQMFNGQIVPTLHVGAIAVSFKFNILLFHV